MRSVGRGGSLAEGDHTGEEDRSLAVEDLAGLVGEERVVAGDKTNIRYLISDMR